MYQALLPNYYGYIGRTLQLCGSGGSGGYRGNAPDAMRISKLTFAVEITFRYQATGILCDYGLFETDNLVATKSP